jgi:hypothetical protein
MTLGKFRFAMTSRGYSVAVRDTDDITGWDRDGRVHKEKVRLEAEFIDYIEKIVAGVPAAVSYEMEAGEVLATPPASGLRIAPTAAFPANTYTSGIYTACPEKTRYPARFTTAAMNAGIQFMKNSAQNAGGVGDGGVATITSGLAAWTNDCGSAIHISYGGTTAALKADDTINSVVFNDPQSVVVGSWPSSGIIAVTFLGADEVNPIHTFEGIDWVSLSNADIVFNDGYAGTEATFNVATTHEIGHAIGLRHSAAHHIQTCSCGAPGSFPVCGDGACQPGSEECATSAVMNASVNATFNFTLQAWDKNAANALYPATCVALNPPTGVVATASAATTINVTWTAAAGATSYHIYRGVRTGGNIVFTKVSGDQAGTSFPETVPSNTAFLYKVRSFDGANESADSNIDLATSVAFTDPTIVAGTTKVKAAHIAELRTAVNAVQTLAGQPNTAYTDPTLNTTIKVKAAHVTELRSRITSARSTLSLSAPSFPTAITAGTTRVSKVFIDELRTSVR